MLDRDVDRSDVLSCIYFDSETQALQLEVTNKKNERNAFRDWILGLLLSSFALLLAFTVLSLVFSNSGGARSLSIKSDRQHSDATLTNAIETEGASHE